MPASISSSRARKSGSFAPAGPAWAPGRVPGCGACGAASVEPGATLAVAAAAATLAVARSRLRRDTRRDAAVVRCIQYSCDPGVTGPEGGEGPAEYTAVPRPDGRLTAVPVVDADG